MMQKMLRVKPVATGIHFSVKTVQQMSRRLKWSFSQLVDTNHSSPLQQSVNCTTRAVNKVTCIAGYSHFVWLVNKRFCNITILCTYLLLYERTYIDVRAKGRSSLCSHFSKTTFDSVSYSQSTTLRSEPMRHTRPHRRGLRHVLSQSSTRWKIGFFLPCFKSLVS